MLKPEDRELLVDAIRPEPGYDLDHALITTYTLDLDALLSIPVALTFHAWSGDAERGDDDPGSDRAGKERHDPVALLEALRRYADKLTVLGQAGAISEPRPSNFLTFLEPVVRGVSAPRGGVFHPKLWLLRFAPIEQGPIRYRLLCLSRNLTFDRSWDTMLRLEATLVEEHPRPELDSNAPLRAFVADLLEIADEAPGGIDPQRRAKIEAMADEVARLEFQLPEGVEGHQFWPLGFDDTTQADVFEGRRDRTLAISPFVSEDFLAELDLGPEDILVSRAEELAAISDERRAKIGRISVIGDVASVEPDPDAEADGGQVGASLEDAPSGLHAKVFVADAGWKARIWTGSANATAAAFSSNVEFMVELRGAKSVLGIKEILLGSGEEKGLDELLVAYEHDPALAQSAEERQLGLAIDKLSRTLGASDLALQAAQADDGWTLKLTGSDPLPRIPDELKVMVWPANLPDHQALPLAGDRDLPVWKRLDLTRLTSFLCVEVAAPGAGVSKRFAIAIPLEGAPSDREAAVIRSVLDKRDHVLRYLLMLLGDHDLSSPDALRTRSDHDGGGFGEILGVGAEATLFESLVRALRRDPERIGQIDKLLRDLGSDDAADLLPEGFNQIFAPVREARRRLGA